MEAITIITKLSELIAFYRKDLLDDAMLEFVLCDDGSGCIKRADGHPVKMKMLIEDSENRSVVVSWDNEQQLMNLIESVLPNAQMV